MGNPFPPHHQGAAVATLAAVILAIMAGRSLFKALKSSEVPSHPVVVAVGGDIRSPGFYLLEGPTVTVGQALEAAGGLHGNQTQAIPAELAARPVHSGQAIRGLTAAPNPAAIRIEPMPAAARLTLGEKLSVNTSSEEELMLVPQMKAEFADAIVNQRRTACWGRLDELEKISGIGPKTVEKWKLYLEATDCRMGETNEEKP